MKIMNIYDPHNELLFSGTRHQVKQYIKRNKIQRYFIKEKYVEKVALIEADEDNDNHLAKPPTPEGRFNRVF